MIVVVIIAALLNRCALVRSVNFITRCNRVNDMNNTIDRRRYLRIDIFPTNNMVYVYN